MGTARRMLLTNRGNETQNRYDSGRSNATRMSGGEMNYGNMGGDFRYEMENRFRDRRGREHYNNGRYAPMRNGYDDGRMDYGSDTRMEMEEPENRRYRRRRDGRFAPRSAYEADGYSEPYVSPVYDDNVRQRRTIGFNSPESHWHDPDQDDREMRFQASVVPLHNRGDHHAGKFDKRMAESWMQNIQNEDGRQGPRWSEEQTKQVMKQRNIDCDPMEFWVTMNMLHADYGKVFSKYGMGDRTDFYADMAKAFLYDKDAVEDKLGQYYEYIVEH